MVLGLAMFKDVDKSPCVRSILANIGPNIRSSHVINEGNKVSSMLRCIHT